MMLQPVDCFMALSCVGDASRSANIALPYFERDVMNPVCGLSRLMQRVRLCNLLSLPRVMADNTKGPVGEG